MFEDIIRRLRSLERRLEIVEALEQYIGKSTSGVTGIPETGILRDILNRGHDEFRDLFQDLDVRMGIIEAIQTDIEDIVNKMGLDHGLLGGLLDDDHTQYFLADGTRYITGTVTIEDNVPTIIFSESDQSLPAGLWKIKLDGNDVILEKNTASAGDFSTSTELSLSGLLNSAVINDLVDEKFREVFHDLAVKFAIENMRLNHGSMGGLTDDDHSQYFLVSGSRNITGAVTIENNTPTIILEESDQSLPDGLWKIKLDTDDIIIEKNTAAAGDFSTSTNIVTLSDGTYGVDIVGSIRSDDQFISTTTGSPPLSVASDLWIQNLNADLLDNYHFQDIVDYILGILSRPRIYGWYLKGSISPGNAQGPVYRTDAKTYTDTIDLHATTAPSGGDFTVDIEYSTDYSTWTSIFSTKPTITSGNNVGGSSAVFSVDQIPKRAYIRLNVDSVNNAQDVDVMLNITSLSDTGRINGWYSNALDPIAASRGPIIEADLPMTLTRCDMNAKTATSEDVEVDIETSSDFSSWSSVFSTLPKITLGGNIGGSNAVFSTTNISAGDWLRFKTSSGAAEGITVQLQYNITTEAQRFLPWYLAGTISTGTQSIIYETYQDLVLTSVELTARTPPSGGAFDLDIEYSTDFVSWSTVFSTRPTIADGQNSGGGGAVFSVSNITADSYLRLNVQTASGAEDVFVQLVGEVS